MKRLFYTAGLLCLMVVHAVAQDVATCTALTETLLSSNQGVCADLETGQGCVVVGEVSLAENPISAGEVFTTAEVTSLTTQGIDVSAESQGIVRLSLPGGLPAGAVNAVLFGQATLTNKTVVLTEEPISLPAKNSAGYDVNLREGAGTTFATVGTFGRRDEAFVNGRSADNAWFRLVTNTTTAWVSASLVSVTGDISTLVVVDSPYIDPLQAFLLQSASVDETCGVQTSGLLLEHSGDIVATLNANGAELRFSTATLLLQATQTEGLSIQVISGEVTVMANRQTATAQGGKSVTVRLDESLLANGTPQVQDRYAFASVAGAPFSLLDSNLSACIVGIPSGSTDVETRGGPSNQYSKLASLKTTEHYLVEGTYTDDNNIQWWKLANGRWVVANDVASIGLCGGVASAEPPAIVTNNSSPVSSNRSLVPAQVTRYQANSGPDVMTGQCTSAPIAICDHLAVVIPNADGTIGWRGQEPLIYTLQPQGGNRYLYVGRNYLNNANFTLDLTFTSATNWTLSMITVFDTDPTCTHTFYYTAYQLN